METSSDQLRELYVISIQVIRLQNYLLFEFQTSVVQFASADYQVSTSFLRCYFNFTKTSKLEI